MTEGYFDFPKAFENLRELKAWLDELDGTGEFDLGTICFENDRGATELWLLICESHLSDGSSDKSVRISTGKSNSHSGFLHDPA